MIENVERECIAKIFLSSPKQYRDQLLNRKKIVQLFDDQHVVIPDSLTHSVLCGETLSSKRFCGFGFDSNNIHLLHRAIINIWGQQGPWDIDFFPDTIRHSTCDFFFTNRLFKMSFAIEWEQVDHVTYQAKKMGIAPEEPLIDSDWCYS
jgi:hypothetical protein